jgi:N-6 DNA Methylase
MTEAVGYEYQHSHPRAHRRTTGTYYTPPELIDCLLDASLEPLLDEAKSPEAIMALRICDPACGCGHFLLAAAKRIAQRMPNPDAALSEVYQSCIFGIDIDPAAVDLCQKATGAGDHIALADTLLETPFDASFDLVLGNPPFVNAIEGRVKQKMKSRLRARYPRLGGTADLAHFFLERSIQLVRDNGRVALVLPRAVLSANVCKALRTDVGKNLRPNLIYAPERCDWFPGAAVFVCLLTLGPDSTCKVGTDNDPRAAIWIDRPIADSNWWRIVRCEPASESEKSAARLGDHFDVHASMTTGEAYELRPFLIDHATGKSMKFVTTGLIDPNKCLWGDTRCRYLGSDYTHPRVPACDSGRSLTARLRKSRRPKILVAGLTKRIECFFDERGEYVGGVSTFSIYHPTDDHAALRRLCKYLLSHAVSQQFIAELGANGMRGQHITMNKRFLQQLHYPRIG